MSNTGLWPWPDPNNHEIQMLSTKCRELEEALIAEKRAHQKLRKRIEERIRELKAPLCSHMPDGDELDEYLEQWGWHSYEAEILTRVLEATDG